DDVLPKPCRKRARLAEMREVPPGADEGILDHVAGIAGSTQNEPSAAQCSRQVWLDETGKSLRVACLRLRNEPTLWRVDDPLHSKECRLRLPEFNPVRCVRSPSCIGSSVAHALGFH